MNKKKSPNDKDLVPEWVSPKGQEGHAYEARGKNDFRKQKEQKIFQNVD